MRTPPPRFGRTLTTDQSILRVIDAAQVRLVTAAEPPPLVGEHERWFDVDLDTQVLVAYEGDRPVAGTLNFMKGDRLFGRYWGAVDAWDALHFECCYYRLIDYAIAEGVTRFEAGAQGQHKIARGFLPSATHSAHFLAHPGLRDAVARHLDYEADAIRAEMAMLADHGPFKSASDADLPDRSG